MAKTKDKPKTNSKPKAKPEKPAPASSYLRRYGIDTVWAHLALNVASVLMLTLAFPKPGWAALAFFAPVPIGVLAMRSTRLWTLGWTTLLVFGVWWAVRILWLTAVSPAAPWGVGLVMGLWMAGMVVALARVQRRFRPAMTLMLPVFWVAQEAARSVWPWGGFPWFTLGSSQAMWKPLGDAGAGVGFPSGYLVQTADLFGVLTVSFVVAMTAGLIVDLIARPMTKRTHTGRVRPRRTVVVAGVLWLTGFGGALVYGVLSLAAADSPSVGRKDQVTITTIQTNVSQSNKQRGTPEQHQQDWDEMFALTDAALVEGPRPSLVVWPETMVRRPINDAYVAQVDAALADAQPALDTGLLEEDEEFRRWYEGLLLTRSYRTRLDEYALSTGVAMLVGGRTQVDDAGSNTAFLIQPGADALEGYSKQQLVPFGEYIPGPAWVKSFFMEHFSPYGPGNDYTLTPGGMPVVFEVPVGESSVSGGMPSPPRPDLAVLDLPGGPESFRIATPICFEDVVGHLCREMVYGSTGEKQDAHELSLQ